ncbi:39S ribosomal protein L38, mitochondrial [Acipenser ruthenus]|uniref:Large ribosomal subunit protein mL38 n=1 Tax=Acipenser ruthenus TaxID=7906 RepID=A0A662Z0H6_ACIRT|nr:39S ribosomal protein L38, mitochondrial [Acipenser ruthenus]
MDIDVKNLDDLEKYRSYTRYLKVAEEESRKVHWWKTYRQYLSQDEEKSERIDIGLPNKRAPRSKEVKERKMVMRENHENSELERATRLRTHGHLRDNDSEYVHWIVGNIPGNAVQSGEQICRYFPPFPAKGTGYHRFIFILFKQERPIDFTEDCLPSPCHSLESRTFQTFDFYRKHQDYMTPAGLAFFQSQWDDSVTHTFHHLLNMKEPVFEYDRPPVYHPPQKKYPHGEPVRYLDRYRDSQETIYGIY